MKKKIINFAIASYLVLIALNGLPLDSLLFRKMKDFSSPFVVGIGLWQGWNMFAPNPLRSDTYIYARLYFKDGSFITKNIEIDLEDNFLKVFREVRWTKWSKDNVRQEAYRSLWEPTLRYMVAKYGTVENPVVKGQLLRKSYEVKLLKGDDSKAIPLNKFHPRLSEEKIFLQIPSEVAPVKLDKETKKVSQND